MIPMFGQMCLRFFKKWQFLQAFHKFYLLGMSLRFGGTVKLGMTKRFGINLEDINREEQQSQRIESHGAKIITNDCEKRNFKVNE